MSQLTRLTSLARNLFQRRRAERELNDEVHSYVQLLADEKIREMHIERNLAGVPFDIFVKPGIESPQPLSEFPILPADENELRAGRRDDAR